MGLKEFFKPTLGKIVLFIILMGLLNFIWIFGQGCLDCKMLVGLPLPFYPVGTGAFFDVREPVPAPVNFSILNFIINIVFWYILSCLIVLIYNKIRK